MWQGRPLWAEIDLDALSHNVKQIRGCLPDTTEVLAVVKANAYGHGAVPVARAALAAGASRLGVACVDEGVQLRRAGLSEPVVILGYTPVWDAPRVVEHTLTPSVTSFEMAQALSRAAQGLSNAVPVHLKVESGMNRLGLPEEDVVALAERIRSLPGVFVEGLYTHFATADEADKSFAEHQFRVFMRVAQRLSWIPYRHVANTAAVLDLPHTALELVRPGISLYGIYPSPHVSRRLDLRPVLTLKSQVVQVRRLRAGDSVSYGRTWTAERSTRVVLIPCGYADGLPRLLSNAGHVLLRGQRAPIVGTVCMDQCLADVGHLPQVAPGDEVVIIGRQGDEEIPVEEVARHAKTLPYEICCGISARVPRLYFQGGRLAEAHTLVDVQNLEVPSATTPSTPPRA